MSVFEVRGGNDRRSMIKRYERKSKQEAIRELIDIIHCNWNQLEQLEAVCTQLRGLTPEPPPRPPEGKGLPRFGLRWNGPGQPLSVPMDDGYWTPWHLANSAADHSEDARPMVPDFVSATDVRGACQDAVDVFAEQPDADQCREVAEYMREVLLALIERRKAAAPQQSAGDTL